MDSQEIIELKIENRAIRLPDMFAVQTGSRVFLTASPQGCLLLYKKQDWLPVRDRLLCNDTTDKRMRAVLRFVIGHGEELIVEKGGLLRISKDLLKVAGLSDAALWVPRDDRIAIWSPKQFKD